jgi:hypothetical protein
MEQLSKQLDTLQSHLTRNAAFCPTTLVDAMLMTGRMMMSMPKYQLSGSQSSHMQVPNSTGGHASPSVSSPMTTRGMDSSLDLHSSITLQPYFNHLLRICSDTLLEMFRSVSQKILSHHQDYTNRTASKSAEELQRGTEDNWIIAIERLIVGYNDIMAQGQNNKMMGMIRSISTTSYHQNMIPEDREVAASPVSTMAHPSLGRRGGGASRPASAVAGAGWTVTFVAGEIQKFVNKIQALLVTERNE